MRSPGAGEITHCKRLLLRGRAHSFVIEGFSIDGLGPELFAMERIVMERLAPALA